MTKEEVKHCIEILHALLEDKEIEMMCNGRWVEGLTRNQSHIEYFNFFMLKDCRIKLEPKYIPYTWEDWKYFMGEEVVDKNGDLWLIIGLDRFEIIIERDEDSKCIKLKDSFLRLKFADGTPFGKLVEE